MYQYQYQKDINISTITEHRAEQIKNLNKQLGIDLIDPDHIYVNVMQYQYQI